MVPSRHFERMVVFTTVVDTGSFTKAAQTLGMSQSMVSQHITRLEKDLGGKLLNRTTRRLALTESGELFYQSCLRITEETESAISQIRHMTERPYGKFRISAQVDFGLEFLVPGILEFVKMYPDIRPELILEDSIADFVENQIDLAIRVGAMKDSSLMASQLGTFRLVLVASSLFFKDRNMPVSPEELIHFDWLHHSIFPAPRKWTFRALSGKQTTIKPPSKVSINLTSGILKAVLQGHYLAVIPDFMAYQPIQEGRLIELLPDHRLDEGKIFMMFLPHSPLPLKVRVFIDFFKSYYQTTLRIS